MTANSIGREQVEAALRVLRPVVSSHVVAVGWLLWEGVGCLVVEFRGGTVGQYRGVPHPLYGELVAAESKGKFLHRHLRPFPDRYQWQKLIQRGRAGDVEWRAGHVNRTGAEEKD